MQFESAPYIEDSGWSQRVDGDMYLTMINTLRRRRKVPSDLFYAYWRDTHVGVAARLPGIDTLYTHWVDFDLANDFPLPESVSRDLPENERFDGVPEPSFAAAEDVAAFADAMAPLMADEANIFERTIGYRSLGDHTVTLKSQVDRLPNGALEQLGYLLFLRRDPGQSLAGFSQTIIEAAEALAGVPEVHKVRYHLLEPYDDAEVFLDAGTEAVSHSLPRAAQHQAVVEVAISSKEALLQLPASPAWKAATALLVTACSAIHPCRITRTYTWRVGGLPTVAALRGAHVVDQIRALNARNQLEPETLALFTAPLPQPAQVQSILG